MDASLQTTKMQIQEIDKQIDAESRRMASHTQAKHEETQRKIDDEKATMGRCDQRLRDIMHQRRSLGVEVDTLKQRGADLESRRPALQEHIRNCEGMIKSAKDREKDALIPYGRNIKTVLEKIKSMRWFGDMPLGPLGQYIKAKDAKTWGDILRNQLGHLLCAFAVTDARDRIQLKRLLQESGKLGLISDTASQLLIETSHS
jgi:chromosome segregation ATPase